MKSILAACLCAAILSACAPVIGTSTLAPAQPTYAITYDGNGSTSGSAPVDGESYLEGAHVTVLGNTGNLVKIGSIFSGWNSKADGSGTPYSAGFTFSMGSAAVTLYAQWTVAPGGGGITVYDPPVIAITLSGQSATLAQTASMTVTLTTSETVDSCAWYLDGYLLQQGGTSCILGPSLSLGAHSLMALVSKNGTLFSASCQFSVQ